MRDGVNTHSAKLAVSNIAWAGLSDDHILPHLKGSAVDGVEVASSLVWEEPVSSSRQQRQFYLNKLRDHGLEVSGLASLLFTRPDLQVLAGPNQVQPVFDYLRKTIDLCHDLCGQYMVLGRPQNRQRGSLPLPEAFKRASDLLVKLADFADQAGITISVEALPKPGCDFVINLEEARHLVDQVGHQNVAMHLDTGAATEAGDLDRTDLEVILAGMQSCQINDHELLPPGRDSIATHASWARVLEIMQYDRWLSIEIRRPDGNPEGTIKQTAKFVRSTYASVLGSG